MSGGADLVIGGADVTSGGADLVIGGADVTSGGADLVIGGADVTSGGADLVICGADVTSGGADLVIGGADVTSGGADLVIDGADVFLSIFFIQQCILFACERYFANSKTNTSERTQQCTSWKNSGDHQQPIQSVLKKARSMSAGKGLSRKKTK